MKRSRNYRCQFYDSCLNLVALAGSKESPCAGCPFEHDKAGQGDLEADLPGCFALLLTIVSDEKTMKQVWTASLLDRIHDRMTEMICIIVGQRKSVGTVLGQKADRRREK
jgi:hypothetical protein